MEPRRGLRPRPQRVSEILGRLLHERSPVGLKLSAEERSILAGDFGPGVRKAMEIVVTLGQIYGARRLVAVESVQVAGVSYRNLGEAGLEFLREWADQSARVRVPTTLNPAGVDLRAWRELGFSEAFARRQVAVIIASPTSRFAPLKVEFDGSNSYDQPESSVPTPGNDEKVLTVGAIYHGDWTTGPQEPYSSQGPTNDSQYAASRTKPDLMGPDGVSNYTYTAFYGTSASSPHVAGAAALLLSEDPSRTAAQLQAKLEVDA
nr:DUF521 domain-containing protein [Anaerolineae bacterium]